MKYPNFREEKKLWEKKYNIVIGLDESGRGPLAGPVVAAAVVVRQFFDSSELKLSSSGNLLEGWKTKKLRSSKNLIPRKREEIYQSLVKNPHIEWAIGRVSEKVIDRINILEATKLAMERAIKNLERKLKQKTKNNPVQKIRDRGFFAQGCFLIIDGNFGLDLNIPQKSIIKADEKVFSCVVASIIAKVARDRMMLKYHKRYPQYGFDKHKGYPTKFHREMIKKYGLSEIHRKTFRLS